MTAPRCDATCVRVDDPIGWTLVRAREIDGGSTASIWQAIGERHTGACIARAQAYVDEDDAA